MSGFDEKWAKKRLFKLWDTSNFTLSDDAVNLAREAYEKGRESVVIQGMPEPKPLWEAMPACLTLRQHYAGLAMQGVVAGIRPTQQGSDNDIARFSVRIADALIAALGEKP